MTVFGFLLQTATVVNPILFLFSSIFATGFYLVLLYTMSWEAGAKDKIRVDGGRLNPTPLKGVLLSLIANIPNILLGVLSVFGWIFYDPVLTEPVWAGNLFGVCNVFSRMINSMYIGIIQTVLPDNPIMLIIISFPAVIASGIGYFIGLHGFSLFNFAKSKAE